MRKHVLSLYALTSVLFIMGLPSPIASAEGTSSTAETLRSVFSGFQRNKTVALLQVTRDKSIAVEVSFAGDDYVRFYHSELRKMFIVPYSQIIEVQYEPPSKGVTIKRNL